MFAPAAKCGNVISGVSENNENNGYQHRRKLAGLKSLRWRNQ
jgi:hypothetical protein